MPIPPETDWLLKTLNSPVNLFKNLQTFDEMVERCKRNGYEVHEFDCRQFKSQEEIYNAILHSVGDLKQENFYKNIMHVQFWDLFRTPWLKEDCKVLMAFRYFDTFHRIDPECGQQLMGLMGGWHYRALHNQTRFIICAYSEDQKLELEPVLVLKAGWNSQPSFSEAADVQKEKMHQAMAWWNPIFERLKTESLTKAYAFTLACDVALILGLHGVIELHQAYPRFDEVVHVLERMEDSRLWWDQVMQQFNGEGETWSTSGPRCVRLRKKLGVKSLVELRELDLPIEELLRFLGESEAEELERRKDDPRYLDRDWNDKVVELFNARSQISKSLHEIYDGLNLLDQEGKERPNRLNSTPEEAVRLLLNLKPQQWKEFGPRTKIIKVEDKDLEL